jgi:hypothetical protein
MQQFKMTVQFGEGLGEVMQLTGHYRDEDAGPVEAMLAAMSDGANRAGFPAEVRLIETIERSLP